MLMTLAGGRIIGIIGIEVTRLCVGDSTKPGERRPVDDTDQARRRRDLASDEVTRVVDQEQLGAPKDLLRQAARRLPKRRTSRSMS